MNERQVLEQRVATLDGLLAGSGGLRGAAGTTLGAKLQATWDAERRLLRRLLSEATADELRPAIELWRQRTAAFIAGSPDAAPGWTDREGHHWNAHQVLTLLDDATERLDSWLAADDPLTDDDPSVEGVG